MSAFDSVNEWIAKYRPAENAGGPSVLSLEFYLTIHLA